MARSSWVRKQYFYSYPNGMTVACYSCSRPTQTYVAVARQEVFTGAMGIPITKATTRYDYPMCSNCAHSWKIDLEDGEEPKAVKPQDEKTPELRLTTVPGALW